MRQQLPLGDTGSKKPGVRYKITTTDAGTYTATANQFLFTAELCTGYHT